MHSVWGFYVCICKIHTCVRAHLVRDCRLCRSSLFKSLLRYAWSDCSLQEHFVRSVEAFPLAELQAKDHEQKMQGGLHPKGVTC